MVMLADLDVGAEYGTLYEAHYNRSLRASSWDGDLGAAGNVSNATTTRPRFTLQPLNLTAIMLDTAAIIDVVHEPFQHAVCRPPDTCLSCPRALPSDGMTQCSIDANRGQWQLLFARGSLLTRDKDLL